MDKNARQPLLRILTISGFIYASQAYMKPTACCIILSLLVFISGSALAVGSDD